MGYRDLTTRTQVSLTIDNAVVAYLREYSKETGMPISRYVEKLVKADRDKNSKEQDANG